MNLRPTGFELVLLGMTNYLLQEEFLGGQGRIVSQDNPAETSRFTEKFDYHSDNIHDGWHHD